MSDHVLLNLLNELGKNKACRASNRLLILHYNNFDIAFRVNWLILRCLHCVRNSVINVIT